MTGEVIASGAQWAGILPHKGQGQFSLIMTVKGSIIHRKAKQSKEGNHGNREHYGSFTFCKNWAQKSRTHLLQKRNTTSEPSANVGADGERAWTRFKRLVPLLSRLIMLNQWQRPLVRCGQCRGREAGEGRESLSSPSLWHL